MTKQELIDLIYKKRGVSAGLTKKSVSDIIDGVFAELGDYFVKARATRNGTHPSSPTRVLERSRNASGPNASAGTPRPATRSRFRRPRPSRSMSAAT